MKLLYFRLKGYINILQGMGLDELIIPFDKLESRIILIQGENGTGKSTILNTMVPSPDPSEFFRTDVYIDESGVEHVIEFPAEKELHYIDNTGSIYKILIKSIVNDSKTVRTTKAFISKDDIEYNPNGNVSSFKDIRDDLFDINPTYLNMSSIGSENRGLVDMIPSERRKYLSSFIGSVETFNNIFKSIFKKGIAIKNEIQNLNGRIYAIGDSVSLETTLERKVAEIASYKDNRDRLIKDVSGARSEIRMLDPNGEIQSNYEQIARNLNSLKIEVGQNSDMIKQILAEFGSIDPYKEMESINNHIDKLEKVSSETSNTVRSLSMYMESIKSDIMNKKSKLESLVSKDYNDTICDEISKMKKELSYYNDKFGAGIIEKMNKISKNDITTLYQSITDFIERINVLKDSNQSDLDIAANCIINNINIDAEIVQIKNDIVSINKSLSDNRNLLDKINKDIDDLELLKRRPNKCKDDTCPFIINLIKIEKHYSEKDTDPLTEKDRIIGLINHYETLLKESNKNEINFTSATRIYHGIMEALSYIKESTSILNKFRNLKWMTDQKKLLRSVILDKYNLSKEIMEIDDIRALIADIDNYNIINAEYRSLKDKYEDIIKSKTEIDSIKNDIEELEKKYNDKSVEMDNLMNELSFSNNLISEVSAKRDKLQRVIDLLDNKDKLNSRMEDLKRQYLSIQDNIKAIKDKTDLIIVSEKEIESMDNIISEMDDEIAELKFKLTNLIVYKNDVEDLKKKFEKTSFLKNLCSPTSGTSIQTEYVKMYMNDIISTCNSLLKYMFNGDLVLQLPVIGEKDFAIPFIGPFGMIVPDISNGSTAQKCMIGLVFDCASMMRMSSKYNLFRLDEIDGGLDTENRYGFIKALNYLLDITNAEQCIMVSHNIEFDTQSVSKIICTKRNGLKFL